ncbi:MAG: methyltransferase domain-containing protein [Candidatus Binataceae bacterium]|jgi:SAM-dependent methyltransferase
MTPMPASINETELQRAYYSKTASAYDESHLDEGDAHFFALWWLSAIIEYTGAKSVLDVGSGTGRVLRFLAGRHPKLRLLGIEPVAELRDRAYQQGVPRDHLVAGDALGLADATDSFDIVCEFGALHHIRDHKQAAGEMARVASLGVFLSDANNFGQGSFSSRCLKQMLHAVGLWPIAKLIKSRGKGYEYSEGDGVYYSYSIFGSLPVVRVKFPIIHQLNTSPAGANLYRTASTVAVFARR